MRNFTDRRLYHGPRAPVGERGAAAAGGVGHGDFAASRSRFARARSRWRALSSARHRSQNLAESTESGRGQRTHRPAARCRLWYASAAPRWAAPGRSAAGLGRGIVGQPMLAPVADRAQPHHVERAVIAAMVVAVEAGAWCRLAARRAAIGLGQPPTADGSSQRLPRLCSWVGGQAAPLSVLRVVGANALGVRRAVSSRALTPLFTMGRAVGGCPLAFLPAVGQPVGSPLWSPTGAAQIFAASGLRPVPVELVERLGLAATATPLHSPSPRTS